MDYDSYDYEPIRADVIEEKRWTWQRVVFLIITVITLISFLAYVFLVPFIEMQQHASLPPLTPTVLPRF